MCGIIYLCEYSPYIQYKHMINSLAECTAKYVRGFSPEMGEDLGKGLKGSIWVLHHLLWLTLNFNGAHTRIFIIQY